MSLDELNTRIDSAIIGICRGDAPVATAVFFSPSRALTAYHTVKPEIGAVLTGKAKEDSRTWKLRVVATSVADNLVVLEREEGPLVFSCMPPQMAIEDVGVPKVWVAYYGVRTLRSVRTGVEILMGNFCVKAEVTAVGTRHFVYSASCGRGDAGGAILDMCGNLIGLQLGSWDMASPPPSPAEKTEPCTSAVPEDARAAEEKAEDVAAARVQHDRVARMGLAEVGSEARQWVLAMASSLRTGGYGVFLGSPAIKALLEAVDSSEAGGASGGSGGGESVVTRSGSGRGVGDGGNGVARTPEGSGAGGGEAASGVGSKRKRESLLARVDQPSLARGE